MDGSRVQYRLVPLNPLPAECGIFQSRIRPVCDDCGQLSVHAPHELYRTEPTRRQTVFSDCSRGELAELFSINDQLASNMFSLAPLA